MCQHDVERHHLLALLLQRESEQRMNGSGPVYVWMGFHFWFYGLLGFGKLRLGLYQVDDGKESVAVQYLTREGSHLVGEVGEDAYDLLTLLSLEFSHTVVGFHHLGRLNEYGSSRGTLVVYDTFYLTFQGRDDGNDESSVAQGRGDIFLYHSLALCCPQYAVQCAGDAALGLCQFTAYLQQLGGGVVAYLAKLVEYLVDALYQLGERHDVSRQAMQGRVGIFLLSAPTVFLLGFVVIAVVEYLYDTVDGAQ